MNTKTRFEWLPFLKLLGAIAIPVAMQNLLTSTGSMVDTMMIATLGENEVAAVGLCAQFASLMFSGYWGFVGGGMLFFAQYWGAKDDAGINRSYGLTWLCMMTVGVSFGLTAVLAPEFVMSIYTDKENIRAIGVQYLSIVGFSYPISVFSMCMSCLLRSTERVRIPLYGGIASVLTNVFLNWVLIFGHFGAPALGVRGAAIATLCAAFVNMFVVLICATVTRYPYLFQVTQHFRFNRAFIGLYFHKCFPILCNEILIGVSNLIINMVLGRQAAEAIAALAVFRTIEGLVIAFFSGFSNAASVLVGKCVGAGELDTAFERAKRLIYLCQGIIACAILLIFAFHTQILHAMSLTGTTFDIAWGLILIYGIAALIRMGNWCMNDMYRSAGDAFTGTVLEIAFMYVLVIPCVVVSSLVFHAPFLLIFAFCYCDEPIRYILMQIHLYSAHWIRPVTSEGQAKLDAFRSGRKLPRSFYGNR